MNARSEIQWSPRVSLAKIRELYINEANGTCSDDLLNEVGFGLYARCQSILEYSAAVAGEVLCKRCANLGSTSVIQRKTRLPSELLRCPTCGWQVRWRVYVNESEKVDGQLHEGSAGTAFRHFVSKWRRCHTREEKILAIDRLVHEFHWNLMVASQQYAPHKPAGVNLLRGSTSQVMETLNELTYGEHTPLELFEARARWLSQKPVSRWFDKSGNS